MKNYCTAIILIFLALSSHAQVNNLSFKFSRISFGDFADSLELKTGLKIFFTTTWTDSLYLDIDTINKSLEELLGKSLRQNCLSFVVIDRNRIVLTKGYPIKTNFREQYLDILEHRAVKPDTLKYPIATKDKIDTITSDEYKVYKIGKPSNTSSTGKSVLSGTITYRVTGNPVTGAVVYAEKIKTGATTNNEGFYSITLPKGQHRLEYRMVGMNSVIRNFVIYSDGVFDIDMTESTTQIEEVIIRANHENQVSNLRLGEEKINVKMLRHILTGFGGSDIIKSSLLLPGVQSVGEASGGYNVRGGAADQNLILLDGAPIINSSHFFGFFSTFNSDLISEATLYKSCVPAKFGGRISSVMDITPLKGNPERVKVSGGINPLTGRLLIEGPVKKTQTTFAIGARATYSDWILRLLPDRQLQYSSALFYDIQGHLNITLDEKNSLSLSGYLSKDKFDYYRNSAFDYGNLASTTTLKHNFNSKLSSEISTIISNYKYRLDDLKDSSDFSTMYYKLNQYLLRADFRYFPVNNHMIEIGLDATYYDLRPGIQEPMGQISHIARKELERERAIEPSFYISDEFVINPELSVSGGLRATFFSTFGPGTEFLYTVNSALTVNNIIDTITFGKAKVMAYYPALDFRISSRLMLSENASLKIGIQRIHQYLHMISNTISISPTDIWKLSDRYIEPETGNQYSAGIYYNFPGRAVETSAEVYYKDLRNILDYKSGAVLLMNEHLETDIVKGNGKAYGIELMAKKQTGTITGWISYTYSRTFMKVDSPYKSEKVNGGKFFPASYDRPNDLKVVLNAKFSRRFNISSVFVYNTGRPITYPVEYFNLNNANRLFYSNRNEYRITSYTRLDLSATLNGNLKLKKINHSSITFSVYNVLGRKNPYSVYFENENGIIKGYQLSIFGQPVYMLTYNFRFLGNASDDF